MGDSKNQRIENQGGMLLSFAPTPHKAGIIASLSLGHQHGFSQVADFSPTGDAFCIRCVILTATL